MQASWTLIVRGATLPLLLLLLLLPLLLCVCATVLSAVLSCCAPLHRV
jgi:hypothetical protein